MKKAGHTPLIAITCGTDASFPLGRERYRTAVENSGGDAVFVAPQRSVSGLAVCYDGLIIPGGKDLPASLYGEGPLCHIVPEESVRIDFEFSLLREIMGRKKPVLGICYGMQLMNVFFQGSLYQDIHLQVPGSLDHVRGVHGISIEHNPVVRVHGSQVNSSHHQAVKKGGDGLKPFAWADDGIIEAFYGEGYRFLVGVQWHPERMEDSLSRQLFSHFVGACRV